MMMNNDLKIAANAFLGVNPELLSAIKVSKSFTGDLSLCKIKQCFDNSYLFSMHIDSERYEYCLVVAYKIIPIEHAILFDKLTGKYVRSDF
ncbi:hypothetical protein [Psychromonas sp. KJ10-2]|uniref:hypothetical protein n=1 Tax=Psychromonas sp. KJ10-2 TaxID=3391822 RepID=UPI0039B6E82D